MRDIQWARNAFHLRNGMLLQPPSNEMSCLLLIVRWMRNKKLGRAVREEGQMHFRWPDAPL